MICNRLCCRWLTSPQRRLGPSQAEGATAQLQLSYSSAHGPRPDGHHSVTVGNGTRSEWTFRGVTGVSSLPPRVASSKAGISEMLEGHQGPITGIHCHTAAGPLDFSHLFVTSSFDWTVKLWSTKVPPPPRSPMMQRVYWVVLSEIDERLAHILLSFIDVEE